MNQGNGSHWLMRNGEVCQQLSVNEDVLQTLRHQLVAVLTPNKLCLYVRDYIDGLSGWLEGTPATLKLAKEFANTKYGQGVANQAKGRFSREFTSRAKSGFLTIRGIKEPLDLSFNELNNFMRCAKLEAPRVTRGSEKPQQYPLMKIIAACRLQGPGNA